MIKKIEMAEILLSLPDAQEFEPEDFKEQRDELFLAVLGFEPRALNVPELLSQKTDYKCARSLYFEFGTNPKDNEINKSRLISSLSKIADVIESPLNISQANFISEFNRYISALSEGREHPVRISIDISGFSAQLLLTTLAILIQYNVLLRIFYSEAQLYHPTEDDYKKDLERLKSEEESGISKGVSEVITLPTNTGENLDNLPELLIAFVTFKPERTKKIIAEVTPAEKDVFWVIGNPPNKKWRRDALIEINEVIGPNILEISTFDYKATISQLENIYKQFQESHHITISALGSKMQNVGLAVWTHIRRDVTLCLSIPKEYDAKNFSEGAHKTWILTLDIHSILKLLNELDNLKRVDDIVKQ